MPHPASHVPDSPARRIRVAQFGLGPIGIESLRLAASRDWIDIIGGVDIDPRKVGRSLGDLLAIPALDNAPILPSFDDLWEAGLRPDIVLHTAGSRAVDTAAQLEPIVRRGVSAASTCEQMLFPRLRLGPDADRLDALCRQHGARILGTGVNPGFVLDLLPICLTGVCRDVTHIHGERVVDASTRREPLQRKIGSGLDPDDFRQRFADGRAGHAGFQESLALIAHALGWTLGDIQETCEPVIADRQLTTQYLTVQPGQTCGLHQTVRAATADGRSIFLDLKMFLAAPDPHDTLRITGDPSLHLTLPGGVPGDGATVAALVNAIPQLLSAPPGLRLVTDLALPACAHFARPVHSAAPAEPLGARAHD